jgi:hypothetical protein
MRSGPARDHADRLSGDPQRRPVTIRFMLMPVAALIAISGLNIAIAS